MAAGTGEGFNLTHVFSTAAIALAVDLLFVFPVSHTSLIGQAITGFSSGVVVPPLNWFATDILGMVNPADALMNSSALSFGGGAGVGAALENSTGALFQGDLSGSSIGDIPVPNPFSD